MCLQTKFYAKSQGAHAGALVEYYLSGNGFIPRQDLQYIASANMPSFAENDPTDFWRLADWHEGSKRVVCREIKIALPVKSTKTDRISLVNQFINKNLGDHALTYIIHNKKGDPHAHIIFTDRKNDGIQRSTPEDFFKLASKEYPPKGGCAKATEWNGKGRFAHVRKVKESWTSILAGYKKESQARL